MHPGATFPAASAPRNYGNVEDVPSPAAVGETVIKSILRTETLPVDGQILVVSLDEAFGFFDLPTPPGDTVLRFGRLRWRVGRRIQEADFDLKAGGTVFALSADWVEIFVVREFDPTLAATIPFEASATLAYGVPNLWPPTRTVQQTVAPVSTSNPLPIPHKAVAVLLTVAAGTTISMDTIDGKGTITGGSQTAAGLINPAPPLPLGQGSRVFTVTNPGPAPVLVNTIFDLGF